MKYVIDLDGTLCVSKDSDYLNSEPITERIARVNDFFLAGNNVVIYTARGMETFNGDVKKANEVWKQHTENQLRDWNLHYTKLILGKPSADFYVDDKAVPADLFFKFGQ